VSLGKATFLQNEPFFFIEMSKEKDLQKSGGAVTPEYQNRTFRFSARYRIIEDLGEGGIGKVYKAYDLWNRKEIALKILTTGKENRLLWENFKNEFLLLTQLQHPGVVEVFDFGYINRSGWGKPPDEIAHLDLIHGKVPYFTMEFVEGRTLHQNFDLSSSKNASHFKDSILTQSEKLYHFIWQICDILEYLHLRGIVHCDLKPDNICVTDRIFNLKLLDFGLFEEIGAKSKKTTKGTLPYMAPEMFSGEPIDERTDLYSLGVILYELVTSKLPFFSDDPMKIVSAHLEQTPIPPKDLNPHLDESLNQFILNLLEKSPSRRPQNASEVRESATTHLKGNSGIAERKTFLSHLYSGELVARDTEDACVRQLLKDTVSSGGRVILLPGEQGVGKSFFLKNLRIRSQLEGILYVDSNCLEDQTKAYQPLIEILRKIKPYLEDHDPRADLAKEKFNQALKLMLQKPRGRAISVSQEQHSTHQKIIESLICVSQILPLVLAIDNLQWADFQTLRFLSQFGQNIEKGKILLACAFRPEEIQEKTLLKELIDGWREMRWCEYIKLDRLDYQKTKIFIRSKLRGERFPEGFFSYMHQNTSGNPFFLTEVLNYLLEKGIIFLKDWRWEVDSERLGQTTVPESMETVLLKNLERYDLHTFDFLTTVAVMGKRFDPELVKKLNLFVKNDFSKILFILVKDQVFIKRESPLEGRLYYEFANQSLQSLLYQRFDEKKKVELHGRIAKLLEERGFEEDEETVFEIGRHYLKSHHHEKAYRYALLSAEKMAQRFANQEVLEYLGASIETTSKFRDKEEGARKKVEALMRRADFHKQIGEVNQALKDYKTILRLTKYSTHLKMIAEAYNDLGDTYRLKHDYKKGLSCLKKALEIRQKLGDPLKMANTLHNMGIVYWIDSQYQQALISFEKALNIYREVGHKTYIASTLNNMGLIFRAQLRYAQAMKYFQESLHITKELGNKEETARCLNNMGATYFDLGKYDEAVKCYLESLKLNTTMKNKKEIVYNLVNLGEVYQKTGDFANALKYSQKGLELAANIDFTQAEGHILKNLGAINFELGHYQKVYEHFDQAKTVAENIQDKELLVLVLINSSKLFMTFNHLQRVEELLDEATKIINIINDDRSLISVYQIKSWLKNKEKKFEESIKLLNRAIELAKETGSQEELFSLNLDFCEVFLSLKEKDKAKEYLNSASCIMRDESARYILLEPKFYMTSGRAEWLSGNLNQAQRNFQVALHKAEKLNKLELLWQIHHFLGKLSYLKHDFEKAYNELQKAGKIVKALSENIKEEELKSSYLKDQRKKELLSDLKNATKVMVGNIEG
jgi:serine/threonine protein kinase/tetratricopeptide (TPR) repeat protein